MGTSIVCVIPKEKQFSINELKPKLENIFNHKCKAAYLHLTKNGRFTKKENVSWWINFISSEKDNPEYITGEGSSFSIDLYKNVVFINCIERFSSLYMEGKYDLSKELFEIFLEISKVFSFSDSILFAAGGFGETDIISDIAYYNNADFEQICKKMIELNGLPATNFRELTEKLWYLKK